MSKATLTLNVSYYKVIYTCVLEVSQDGNDFNEVVIGPNFNYNDEYARFISNPYLQRFIIGRPIERLFNGVTIYQVKLGINNLVGILDAWHKSPFKDTVSPFEFIEQSVL